MIVSGIVTLMTCATFFLYEYYSFRKNTLHKISTFGEIISANSTAALAFDSKEDAEEILAALKAEPHIITATIYDSNGKIFCTYPTDYNKKELPSKPGATGYKFIKSFLEGFQPIIQGSKQLGTLYLKSDLKALNERFELYGAIIGFILCFALLISFLLSKFLQQGISKPILALSKTAKAVSEQKDYSVRSKKFADDEVGSLTDAFNQMLTQIEEQNQELNEFNQKLEQKVNERTTELEAAYKELEGFSYSVSHDLRAPLRAINSYSKIIQEEYINSLDEDAKKYLGSIQSNSYKMGLLIDDLLSFSKLGKKEIKKSKVNIEEMVKNVIKEITTSDNYHAVVKVNDLPEAMADYSLINQVWINLISNALKYSKKKEHPEVIIGSIISHNETTYFIKDNGAGFDMEYYNKLFGVFQRLHDSHEFEGTGIGLAIVNRVVTKHGGKVWAEGKLGEGATFYFTLPKIIPQAE